MLKRFLAALTLGLVAFTAQAADYEVLSKPGRVDKPGMIEVREFFWYGCPHCYHLEPHVTTWLKTKPANVNFVRTPASLNPVWEQNARGYYTAETLGILEKTHGPLFQAIQVGRQRLFDKESLTRFYAGFGANPANFGNLYDSFAVSGKVAQGKALAQQYGLDGVPAVVVNGKYLVKGSDAKVMATVNELIAKERLAMAKKK
ncbi:MAG: thiol:disulfide interchange protein DsbA/DsbL [Moraxellaceae bacterium]|nr:thiol:disulfide interchange protein DsbA/DsbL [Moraxellaceae bacterium]